MGLDPKCNQLNSAKRPVQETVLVSADGGLANVFVNLKGSFPATPVPTEPVTIDQHGCIYFPRVAGIRAGQTLVIRNSDALRHNVHSVSLQKNDFNVDQGNSGVVNKFTLKAEEIMVRLKCDVHNWMTAYVGVVNHPYFAVTNDMGSFEIAKAPAGTYTIQTWHERYGMLSQTVRVKAGAATTLDFTYTGTETPKRAAVQDLNVSGEAVVSFLR